MGSSGNHKHRFFLTMAMMIFFAFGSEKCWQAGDNSKTVMFGMAAYVCAVGLTHEGTERFARWFKWVRFPLAVVMAIWVAALALCKILWTFLTTPAHWRPDRYPELGGVTLFVLTVLLMLFKGVVVGGVASVVVLIGLAADACRPQT